MKPIVLEDWRRRVQEAWSNGGFSDDDREVISGEPCGCIKGELGNILGYGDLSYSKVATKFPITDNLESIMVRAVEHNDVSTAEHVLDIMEQIPSLYHVHR